jgi:CRISPR system Cascade subunit CasA
LITSYKEVNKGTEYQAPMKHPLSPFDGKTRKKSILTQPGGVSYRHWRGFIISDSEREIEPARIVHEFINERQQPDWQFRLWAFGFDTDNMKARCWYDSKMPLITVEYEDVSEYENIIAALIKAANIICGNIKIAIKQVLYGIPEYDAVTRQTKWKYQDIKKLDADEEKARERVLNSVREQSLFMSIETNFWQITEPAFYSILRHLTICIKEKKDCAEFLDQWHRILCKEALRQFDSHILSGPIENMKIKHIALAQKGLNGFNRGAIVRQILGLP